MDRRTTGIVATIASILLCGCPGLLFCIFGALTAANLMTSTINGVNTGYVPPAYGYGLLCLALVFILIPVVIGFMTLRQPAAPTPPPPPPDQTIPPAI